MATGFFSSRECAMKWLTAVQFLDILFFVCWQDMRAGKFCWQGTILANHHAWCMFGLDQHNARRSSNFQQRFVSAIDGSNVPRDATMCFPPSWRNGPSERIMQSKLLEYAFTAFIASTIWLPGYVYEYFFSLHTDRSMFFLHYHCILFSLPPGWGLLHWAAIGSTCSLQIDSVTVDIY